jgi:hypothetical protein
MAKLNGAISIPHPEAMPIPLPVPIKGKAKAGAGRPKKGYWATVGDGSKIWHNIREWYPPKLDGKQTRVPSVTTILSRFKDGGGLTHWAWQLGMDGQDYRDVRDEAAGAGTLAHDNVERHIHGQELCWDHPDPDVVKRAKRSFEAFLRWADQSQLEVTHTEVPLVSDKYLFGGTLDDILVKGQRAIGDWKTSNRLYSDYFVQVAGGYKILWEEHHPEEPVDGGIHIVRFDKTYGDFEHRHFQNDIEIASRAFLLQRELYEIDKELKRRIG